MADNSLISVSIGADDSDFRNKISGLAGFAQNNFGKIAAMAAGFFSFRAIVSGLKDIINLSNIQEQATAQLSAALKAQGAEWTRTAEGARGLAGEMQNIPAALKAQGAEWTRTADDLHKFAGELQRLTIYGDETTEQVMALGLNMGISSGQIKQATRAAMGLAAAGKMDLPAAMRLIARASNGSTEMLTRYGITVDRSKSKQEQFQEVLRKGSGMFKAAEAEASTFGGRLIQLNNAWGDFKERLGDAVKGVFSLGETTSWLTDGLSNAAQYLEDHMAGIIRGGQMVVAYFTYGARAVYATVAPALEFIISAVKAAFTNIANLGSWLGGNIGKIWTNQGKICGAILKDIWNAIKGFAKSVFNLLTNTAKAVWTAIKGGGLKGFHGILDKFTDDLMRTVADIGTETAAVMEQAGITEMPDMISADFAKLAASYKNLPETLGDIADKQKDAFARIEDEYQKRLDKNKEPEEQARNGRPAQAQNGPNANRKTDVVGNFSLRAFALMMGGSSPQTQTAQNTRKIILELNNIQRRLNQGITTTATTAYSA